MPTLYTSPAMTIDNMHAPPCGSGKPMTVPMPPAGHCRCLKPTRIDGGSETAQASSVKLRNLARTPSSPT